MNDPIALARRDVVLGRLVRAIAEGLPIRLPQPSSTRPARTTAWEDFDEASEFAGVVGRWRYLFEGEDDLLHLVVARRDGSAIPVAEAWDVVAFLLPDVPRGLIWIRPGTGSHHFYLGHECLHLSLSSG